MEKQIRVQDEDLGSSNLRYVTGLMTSHNVTTLEELTGVCSDLEYAELFTCDDSMDIGDTYTIDVPELGYRLNNVTLECSGSRFYNKTMYKLLGFSIEKIYHLVSYSNSTDGVLLFFREGLRGYTTSLTEAGCFTGETIRSKLDYYHNGNKSTGILSSDFYSGKYRVLLTVDYQYRSEVKAAVEQGVLEYGDIINNIK